MIIKKLLDQLNLKELYLSVKEYVSHSKIQKAIDSIISQIDQQINDLTSQIKLRFSKV